MADKRNVQRNIQRIQRVKTWQLVILLLLAGLLAATFLRLNNIGMIERRTAVLLADKQGNEAALANNLFSLQRWSAAHMNASTDIFYLEKGYERAVKKITKETNTNDSKTASIVKKADEVCKRQYGGYSQAYVQCFVREQEKYNSKNTKLATPELPSPALYRHEFTSPSWSPDFAGWSLVLCVVITVVIILRIISLLILKALLRKHYTSI